jgi:hypothetical protein
MLAKTDLTPIHASESLVVDQISKFHSESYAESNLCVCQYYIVVMCNVVLLEGIRYNLVIICALMVQKSMTRDDFLSTMAFVTRR